MFSRLREPFGKAGLIVAIVALVAALVGGAYAASSDGGATVAKRHHKKAHHKKSKARRGPRGKTGPAGPQGPAGPKGDKGDNGSNGAGGPQGEAGAAGSQGAKGDTGAAGSQGPKGDTGDTGPQGPAGEAGMCSEANPDCTLASGATLTGVWGVGGEADPALVPITFQVDVSPAPTAIYNFQFIGFNLGKELRDEEVVYYGPYPDIAGFPEAEADEEAYEEVCNGSAAEPKAEPGYLCIYPGKTSGIVNSAAAEAGVSAPTVEAADESGVVLPLILGSSTSYQSGRWAVTAE
jgi:Collagen triple helix repeat (20 copies)